VSDGNVYPIFYALLFTADVLPSEESKRWILNIGSHCVKCLNPEIQNNRERAMSALILVVACPDKAHFYSVLANCVPPGTSFKIGGKVYGDERL